MWTEESLALMERLSIQSYLYHKVPYHLYLYRDVKNIPAGTIVHDAHELVPESCIRHFKHPQQFADYFRYVMLFEKGGWHVDLDSVCLKPFDQCTPYVFVQDNIPEYFLAGSFMKAPKGSQAMQFCADKIRAMTLEERIGAGYLDVGPRLVHRMVTEFKLERYIAPKVAFDPVPWNKITQIVDPNIKWDLSEAYAVHLRNSMWDDGPNANGVLDSEKQYSKGCLYEQLKEKYL
jgi:mannosyltransferase OCH1-like enzyme